MQTNDPAIDFSLACVDGETHSLQDFAGKYVLLYFYPKDDTAGCTKEACGVRDSYAEFEKLDIVVLGVSADSIASHKKFAEKYALPFHLLSDPDKTVIKAYGAGGVFIRRISYLIDGSGIIIKKYPKVDPSNHAKEILANVRLFVQGK